MDSETRALLLRLHGGSKLTRSQTPGGCSFWFLDGSAIGDWGPRELASGGWIEKADPSGEATTWVLSDRARLAEEPLP